ncbi:MAG: class I SAM-dependent methyltransferase [Hyphomicrobium sp.]
MDNKPAIDLTSDEFAELVRSQPFYDRFKNDIGRRVLFETQLHDPIVVKHEASPQTLEQILSHIQRVWTKLGSEEPHWSVVSTSDFKANKIQNSVTQFNDTGRAEARNAARMLARIGLQIPKNAVALEYGCGVGRVTRWLAESCEKVIGVDVSTSHLRLAQEYMTGESVGNVSFVHVTHFSDIERLPTYDFLYSKIVLQHNPPPVIAKLLDYLLSKLTVGGIGIVQIPTYAKGYTFDPDEYVKKMDHIINMEMHILPQPVIFELLSKHNCIPREVIRDHLVTTMDFVSTTFAFQKVH